METKRTASSLLVSLLVVSFLLPAVAQGLELKYDDGEFDYGWSDLYPLGAAARFSPPTSDWKIEEIRFYGFCQLRGPPGYFYVEVWDQNLRTLCHDFYSFGSFFKGKNATAEWYAIPLNIIVRGDFYVVIVPSLTLNGSKLWIGSDEDEPISNRSFLVDGSNHTIIQVWNAESGRPKNFMIRVQGSPVPTAPELKLTSVETNAGSTVLNFDLLRASIQGVSAKLLKGMLTSDEKECVVLIKGNSSFSVNVEGSGVLNVQVATDLGTVTASVKVGGSLQPSYEQLLRNIWQLRNESATTTSTINELRKENSLLREALNESQIVTSVLTYRINKMAENNTNLTYNVDALNKTVEDLRMQNQLLFAISSIAVIVVLGFVLIEVRKRWKMSRSG